MPIPETLSDQQRGGSDTVREHFDSAAPYWREIYGRRDVEGIIYQERLAAILSLVAGLGIPLTDAILEVGCGAGSAAIALAQQGHAVTAIDVSEPMLEITRLHAGEAGVGRLVQVSEGDVHRMPFRDNSFSVVIAVGVLPWLPSIHEPLAEMLRVLRPGGHLIVTMDNRFRMIHVLHPFAWARLVGIKVPEALRFWDRSKAPRPATCSVRGFDAHLAAAGLEKVSGRTLGFGQFWMLNRILPEALEVKLHRALQALADKSVPLLRSAGIHYITLSRKAARVEASNG